MTFEKFYQRAVAKLKSASPEGGPFEGIATPELDVKVLIKEVLLKDEASLLLHPQMLLTNYQLEKLNKLVKKRANNQPIAYLVGHKEFFGYDFMVNKNVLIPRPETEFLVEEALRFIKQKSNKNQKPKTNYQVLDMGTGSGCIIISLTLELEKLCTEDCVLRTKLHASDISKKALNIAKKNAAKFGIKNKIKFYHSDLFGNRLLHKKYDIIIANLPYVPLPCHPRANNDSTRGSCSIQDSRFHGNGSIRFEPQNAIFADDNGAAIIEKFLIEAKKYLNTDGTILIELDPRNAKQIEKFANKQFPEAKIDLKQDLARLDRYLFISI